MIANKLYTLTNVVSVGRCGEPKLEKLFANAFKEAMHVINDCSIDDIEGRQNVQGGYPLHTNTWLHVKFIIMQKLYMVLILTKTNAPTQLFCLQCPFTKS